jgi:hypothetical protein
MDLLGTWRSLYTLRYVPVTFVHVIFSAGTIFLLSTLHATSGARFGDVSLHSSLSQMDLCLRYLQEVGRSYHCARDVANILNSLLQKRLKPKPVQGPSPVPQVDSASGSQLPPQMSPPVSAPQPSYVNEIVSGPPPPRDPQPSSLFRPALVVNHPHMQAEHPQQNAGWTPAYPPTHGSAPPGPPYPNTVFGPPPMGPQVMGGEALPVRPLREPMRYDEEYYQHQLGLHPEHEPLAQNPLTDEDNDRVQQFLNQQRQSFDAHGWPLDQ